MKIGDEINTPHGKGIILFKENFDSPRFCVKLENNPFIFPIACYFIDDLKKINSAIGEEIKENK